MSRQRDERGAGTVLVIGVLAVLIMVGAAATVVSGYAGAAHLARNAADLAALSGAHAMAGGAEACPVAARIAERNGARLADCAVFGDTVEFAVAVTVEVGVRSRVPGLPVRLTQRAWAGSIPAAGGEDQ